MSLGWRMLAAVFMILAMVIFKTSTHYPTLATNPLTLL
jgi:hypothetical protein